MEQKRVAGRLEDRNLMEQLAHRERLDGVIVRESATHSFFEPYHW